MSYSVVHVDEIETAGPGGVVRFVRRELEVEAFGINWFEMERSCDSTRIRPGFRSPGRRE